MRGVEASFYISHRTRLRARIVANVKEDALAGGSTHTFLHAHLSTRTLLFMFTVPKADVKHLRDATERERELNDLLKRKIRERTAREKRFVSRERRRDQKKRAAKENVDDCQSILHQAEQKRKRAEASLERDLHIFLVCQFETARSRAILSAIRSESIDVSLQIEAKSVYFTYLLQTSQMCLSRANVGTEAAFENVVDLIDRYKVLVDTNERLQTQITHIVREQDELQRAHKQLVDHLATSNLALMTHRRNLTRQLASSTQNSSERIASISHFADKTFSRRALVSRAHMAAEDMYARCSRSSHVSRLKSKSSIAFLITSLGHYLQDVGEIIASQKFQV